jgi:hypothetical protein
MQREPDYGPRLSGEEYEREILGLHRGLPPLPSPEQDKEARWRELELAIDHRLGLAFPAERRAALWAVQQRIERKRLLLGIKYLLHRAVARALARNAQSLAEFAAAEYATVLSSGELKRFLDLREGEQPALPVDIEHFPR